MATYLSIKNTARTNLTTLDKNNLTYEYPDNNDFEKHWEARNQCFLSKGYIKGYPNSKFLPDNPITRAEFVVVLNKVLGINQVSSKVFDDTANHWAKEGIDIAVTNGVPATEFRPDDYITREEAAKMIANNISRAEAIVILSRVEQETLYKNKMI